MDNNFKYKIHTTYSLVCDGCQDELESDHEGSLIRQAKDYGWKMYHDNALGLYVRCGDCSQQEKEV